MAQKKLKMIRYFWIPLLTLLLFITFTKTSFAESSYVLPYPSFMPGSKFYMFQQIKDTALQYWYFGNFGQFSYNLKQSDKYLIQAKTLFEYNQHLLGLEALKKSDFYFKKSPSFIAYAKKESKNIDRQQKILKDAVLKHIELLNEIKNNTPKEIIWNAEKSQPTKIFLSNRLEEAILIRESCL